MDNVNLKASPETRAQILQLIALEKLANGKDYTIKSYLEHLVRLAAHGNFDEAGKIDWFDFKYTAQPTKDDRPIAGYKWDATTKQLSVLEYADLLARLKSESSITIPYVYARYLINRYGFTQPICAASGPAREFFDWNTGASITIEADDTVTLRCDDQTGEPITALVAE